MSERTGLSDLPGGPISSRPLRFFWVLDVSGSMDGEKIGQLNFAVREALPAMRDVAQDNVNAAVEIKVLTFSTGHHWLTPAPVPLEKFTWTDVKAGGITDMGAALKAVATELSVSNMPQRALPPVIVLVSDGQPTDDFDTGLEALMKEPWVSRSIRLAIAIGQDADLDPLRRFIGHAEIAPLEARNSEALVKFIRWVSTEGLKASSAPPSIPTSNANNTKTTAMDYLSPPPAADPDGDVW